MLNPSKIKGKSIIFLPIAQKSEYIAVRGTNDLSGKCEGPIVLLINSSSVRFILGKNLITYY